MSAKYPTDSKRADAHPFHVDNIEILANAARTNPKKEPPVYVANLSPAERTKAEKVLVRKIDLRLLPTIIIMYILNYLDRNNIVSCRLGISLEII